MNMEELIKFSQKAPWITPYSEPVVRRFMTELISTPDLIFDIHDLNGRMAVAVLLDRVNNPANDACLEIVAIRPDADPIAVFGQFVELAKEHTPINRSGFQIELPAKIKISKEFLHKHDLIHYYDTFDMQCTHLESIVRLARSEIVEVGPADCVELYKVLCEAFAQSPDTSIPDEEAWRKGFLSSSKGHYYAFKEANKIVGFSMLVMDQDGAEAEIRTLGVLSSHRGKGIGHDLLNYCMSQAAELGVKTCRLTVSVSNEKALGLYMRSGFQVTNRASCYRAQLN